MKSPKPVAPPPPTPLPDPNDIVKAKKKTTAETLARQGGRASTILTQSEGKLGA